MKADNGTPNYYKMR